MNNFLKKIDLYIREGEEPVYAKIEKRMLSMHDEMICVFPELNQNYEVHVSISSLRKLSNICDVIEDQPLVICFDTNERINIQSIVI